MLEDTLLEEPIRAVRLPIWKNIALIGDPVAPALIAERVTGDDGQNQFELGDAQLGSMPVEGGTKNNPLEPLSMILP